MADGTPEDRRRALRPGWPFVTRDLIKQRARQRQDLRLVEHHIVLRAVEHMGAPPGVEDTDRGLVEWELRRVADGFRADLGGILGDMATVTVAEAMQRFGEATYGARRGKAEALGLQMGKTARTTLDELQDSAVEDAQATALFDYILTLVMADELADDGYRDPRIPR